MSGREAIAFVRTLSPLAIRRLMAGQETSATLRLVCRMALERSWPEVLASAGLGEVQRLRARTPLIGRWATGGAQRRPRRPRVNGTTGAVGSPA